jgi:phosphomannomutase
MDALDKIFKAYDIRGIYPIEINEDIAYKVGRGVAKFLKAGKIVIGRDNRLSSDSLFQALCDGVQDEGTDVLDIGITTTPIFYLVVTKYGYGGGVMISASHNPKEYNGFKIVKSGSMPIGEESGLLQIKKIVRKLTPIHSKHKIKRGKLEQRDVLQHYLKNILRFVDIESIKPLKVVVDTANGAAGPIIEELDKRLPITMVHLFSELDGRFPNHQPNPMHPAATATLQEKILKQKADFGIAFDGDGDRILFIDEKGERINPNYIAALIVNRFFNKAGGRISFDTPTSWTLREEIKKTGNIPICTKVGHVYLKEKILRQKAIFGAESSGHYYLLDDYSVESPFYVFFRILELLSKEKKSLSQMIKPFEKYYMDGAVFKTDNAEKKMKKVEKFYKDAPRISLYDGVSIDYPNWHFVLRLSHTEPVMRLVVEATTQKLLDTKMKQIKSLLEKK